MAIGGAATTRRELLREVLGPGARARADGRCSARSRQRAPVFRLGSTAAIGLAVWVVAAWLVIAGAVASTLPAAAESTPTAGLLAVPGRTARIHQPGLPDWPIPVDRHAYDEYHRGARESDDEAIEHAFAAFEWIAVSDRQAVKIVEVDGEAVQVELLEGRHVGRRGWLQPRHLGP
jgi:hypothetical protein